VTLWIAVGLLSYAVFALAVLWRNERGRVAMYRARAADDLRYLCELSHDAADAEARVRDVGATIDRCTAGCGRCRRRIAAAARVRRNERRRAWGEREGVTAPGGDA
jgi:hypothetical protein